MSGRIPQQFIEDIIERTDIIDVISARIKLKKAGQNYTACCPFHQEKTPSFSVSSHKQFYHCFGCGAGGNVISFIMDYENRDFRDAVSSLAQPLGLSIPEESPQDQQLLAKKRSLYDSLEEAIRFYHQALYSGANQAQSYIKQRGLNHESIKLFELGYAKNSWSSLTEHLTKLNYSSSALDEVGLISQSEKTQRHYDRFRNRLIFPIRDSRGKAIGFGGRVFDDSKPKYLNSPETVLFQKQKELYGLFQVKQSNKNISRIIVVEGYLDVISLHQHQINQAVATLGTAISSFHLEKIFRLTETVIFCFDGDKAGRKAAEKALSTVLPFMEGKNQAQFLFLPEGEDPDSIILKKGTVFFESLIEKSQSLSTYLLAGFTDSAQPLTADHKARLIQDIAPLINTMPKGSYQELILAELSQITALPIDTLKRLELNQTKSPPIDIAENSVIKKKPALDAPYRSQPISNLKANANLIGIQIALLSPESVKELALSSKSLEAFNKDDQQNRVFKALLDFILASPNLSSASIIGHWIAREKEIIQQSMQLDIKLGSVEENAVILKACLDCDERLKNRKKVKLFIEKTKLNPNLTLNDMSEQEKKHFLQLFDHNGIKEIE